MKNNSAVYQPFINAVHNGNLDEFMSAVDDLKKQSLLQNLGSINIEAVLCEWNYNRKNRGSEKKGILLAMCYLIENGVSVKGTNLLAVVLADNYERCSMKLLNLLVESGADINGKYLGYSALMYACKGYDSLGKIKFFLDNNADVNALSPNKENALILFCNNRGAFFNGDRESIDANFKKVAQELIGKTKSLDLKDKKGNTALGLLDAHQKSSLCVGAERVNCAWLYEQIKKEIELRQK